MSDVSTTSLRCSSCGSPLQPSLAGADVVTCKACGAVLDVSDPAAAALLTTLQPKDFPPRSFIRLGMIGTFYGKKYQVIGRLCYRCRIREWDNEDSQYYRDTWSFDEWVLVGENKEYLYLCEDEEGYALEKSFTPTAPKIPEDGDTFLHLDATHRPQRIQEFGTATLAHFEGEFTWLPKLNDTVESAEYRYGVVTYSVEWRKKEDSNEIDEVEFFQSTPITLLDVAKAFEQREILEEEERKAAVERQMRIWSAAFFGAAAVLFLLFLYSLIRSGTQVASLSLDFRQIPEQGFTGQPITLKKKGSVHKLQLRTQIRDNSWAWGGVELLDSSQQVVNAFAGDFWRESGRDSDGAWSESDVSETTYFRLETPGVYYPRFFVEEGTAGSGTLSLQVYEGVVLSRYYLIAFLLSVGLGYSVRRFKTLNPVYALVGVVLLGWILLEMLPDDD